MAAKRAYDDAADTSASPPCQGHDETPHEEKLDGMRRLLHLRYDLDDFDISPPHSARRGDEQARGQRLDRRRRRAMRRVIARRVTMKYDIMTFDEEHKRPAPARRI